MKGISGNLERKLAQMMAGPDTNLQIGLGGNAELVMLETVPGSLRVAMACNGVAMMLTPRQARALAETFEKNPGTKAHNLEWIPETLRSVADEIDAKVTKHN